MSQCRLDHLQPEFPTPPNGTADTKKTTFFTLNYNRFELNAPLACSKRSFAKNEPDSVCLRTGKQCKCKVSSCSIYGTAP